MTQNTYIQKNSPDNWVLLNTSPEFIEHILTSNDQGEVFSVVACKNFKPTQAQLQKGLQNSEYFIKEAFVNAACNHNVELTTEQINTCLSDASPAVRRAILKTKQTLTEEQIKQALQDQESSVIFAVVGRPDFKPTKSQLSVLLQNEQLKHKFQTNDQTVEINPQFSAKAQNKKETPSDASKKIANRL